jgi:hypothetical protein
MSLRPVACNVPMGASLPQVEDVPHQVCQGCQVACQLQLRTLGEQVPLADQVEGQLQLLACLCVPQVLAPVTHSVPRCQWCHGSSITDIKKLGPAPSH